MGGKTTTSGTQSSTQRVTTDPRFTEAAFGFNDRANEVADGFAPVFMSDLPGLNQDQLASQNAIRNLGISDFLPQRGFLNNALNFNPSQITAPAVGSNFNIGAPSVGAGTAGTASANRGDIRDVAAQGIDPSQFTAEALRERLAAFDPSFTQEVIDTSLGDINRTRQISQLGNADQAARSGAFGGSRQGILEAGTNEAFGRIAAGTAADLRLRGFNTALGTLQQDLDRSQQSRILNAQNDLQAQGLNQGTDANVALANAGFAQSANNTNAQTRTQASIAQGSLANQAAIAQANLGLSAQTTNANNAIQAAALNSDNQFRATNLGFGASDRLTGLAALERDQAIENARLLDAVGNHNFGLEREQNFIDFDNAVAEQQAPLTALQIRGSGLNFLPRDQTITNNGTSEQVTRQSAGLLDILGGAFQLGSAFVPGLGGGVARFAGGGSPIVQGPVRPSLLQTSGSIPAPNLGF